MLFKNDKYLIMVVCMLVLALIENILEAKPSLQNRDISFSFDYSSLDINVGSDSVGSFDGKIKNISENNITIAIVRSLNSLPEHWTSSICLNGLCYHESIDSLSIELNLGDSTTCGILVWTNGIGTGMIQLDLFDLNIVNQNILIDLNIYTTTSGITNNEITVPEQLILYPAFPNPFNPVTTLNFKLNIGSFVNIFIYDVNGRLVRNLLNRDQPPGLKIIRWDATADDGSMVPSGIYLYVLKASSLGSKSDYLNVKTGKIILVQ